MAPEDKTATGKRPVRVVELFAGVGGFRLGLEAADSRFDTVMADQWEPGKKKQVAAEVYAFDFGMAADGEGRYTDGGGRVLWSRDIAELVGEMQEGSAGAVPEHDLLVGGFPCFVAGTPILVRRPGGWVGDIPIEDVTTEDEALTHLGRWQRVTAVFVNPRGGRGLYRILAGTHEAEATGNHRFWVQRPSDPQPGWMPAANVRAGDRVYCPVQPGHADWAAVTEAAPVDAAGRETVYNLEVEGDNSYVAGGMAAHNCQDYSVAKPLSQSHGLEGKKGVLWWSIRAIAEQVRPEALLLENVDRLLKSPSKQRGRDFAIILSGLSDLGYTVEWQVVNAADYGFPQRRRRVFILARRSETRPLDVLMADGVLPRALPLVLGGVTEGRIEGEPWEITEAFNAAGGDSPFSARGVLRNRTYLTARYKADYAGPKGVLGDLLQSEEEVPSTFITDAAKWAYCKGAKDEPRVHPSGFEYRYKEGALPFPDPLDKPARTILTSEGGAGASRTTHCVEPVPGCFRRLTPVELERISGFPDDWTSQGLTLKPSAGQRGFLVGNALVVGVVERIGRELAKVL